jgi:uncharacterized protein YjbJ (UPF0337 family)
MSAAHIPNKQHERRTATPLTRRQMTRQFVQRPPEPLQQPHGLDRPRRPWNQAASAELAIHNVSRAWASSIRRVVVDWNRIEGSWKQLTGRIKERWGDLTDDDLDRIAGRRDQFEGLIQQRYGLTKDQARKQIEEWFDEQRIV